MKRPICFILCLSMTLMFCSCQSQSKKTQDATAKTEEIPQAATTAEIGDDVPEFDFHGKAYTILTETSSKYYKQVDEENGETINDAVYRQQISVDDRFNVDIKVVAVASVNDAMKKSVSAGLNDYQITASHLVNQGAAALAGVYLNLYKIPHLNFDRPWWNKNAIDEFTMDGKVMLAFGDLATERAILYTHTYIFNKRLAQEYSVGNLYDLVRSGQWTYENLWKLAKVAAKDLNGDSIMDESDQYGLLQSVAVAGVYRIAFAQPFTTKDEDGYPVLALNTPKMIDIAEKVYALSYENEGVMTGAHAKEATLGTMFANGQSLLYNGFFCDIDKLRAMDDDFGFLPFPKYDESQDGYYTTVRGDNCLLGIPVNTSEDEYEFVGAVTEALSAAGYKFVRPAVYDITLKNKVTRDDDSIEMLDLITKGIAIDFNLCYNDTGPGWPLWYMLDAKTRDFASYYEAREPKLIKYYEKVANTFKDME